MGKFFVIKKNREFQQILNINQKVKTASYLLFYRRSNYIVNRIGIAVSRKKYPVVVKNKIKRQIRAMLHHINQQRLWLLTGVDVVVLVKKRYLVASFARNSQVLLRGLQSIRLH